MWEGVLKPSHVPNKKDINKLNTDMDMKEVVDTLKGKGFILLDMKRITPSVGGMTCWMLVRSDLSTTQ
jgi:hypothetical protein